MKIVIANPPVSCLGRPVRLESPLALESVELDTASDAVALLEDGKVFSIGSPKRAHGSIPWAGRTQSLPRAMGRENAPHMMLKEISSLVVEPERRGWWANSLKVIYVMATLLYETSAHRTFDSS